MSHTTTPHTELTAEQLQSALGGELYPLQDAERKLLSVGLTSDDATAYRRLLLGESPEGRSGTTLSKNDLVERTAYFSARAIGAVDVRAVGQITAWSRLTGHEWRRNREYRQKWIVDICRTCADGWWDGGRLRTVAGDPVDRTALIRGYDAAEGWE
jgi:hypothetical protein